MSTQSKILRSVIASKDGLHLSVYLENKHNLQDLRIQIDDCLETAREILRPVMTPEELRKFIAPLLRLRKDTRTLRSFKGNIGFFRNERWSRIVSLPVAVEPLCVVADTFHTKPVLRWLQQDQEFLLVYVGEEYANLFWGNLTAFEFVDSLPMHRPEETEAGFTTRGMVMNSRKAFFLHWINSAIEEMGPNAPRQLFISGDHPLPEDVLEKITHNEIRVIADKPKSIQTSKINFFRDRARAWVSSIVSSNEAAMLAEFAMADKLRLATTDMSEVARLVAEDRVETLFVAGDKELFGRFDSETGRIDLNPIQTDHLDDCVLDDIAQTAADRNIKVLVLEQESMPKMSSVAAIVRREPRQPWSAARLHQYERRA